MVLLRLPEEAESLLLNRYTCILVHVHTRRLCVTSRAAYQWGGVAVGHEVEDEDGEMPGPRLQLVQVGERTVLFQL